MSKNPLVNAFAASGYIVLISFFMSNFVDGKHFPNERIFAPIVMLSIFTLSAAVMAYIFVSQPLRMYFDEKAEGPERAEGKKEAVNLFLHTLGFFAAITAVILAIVFSGLLS